MTPDEAMVQWMADPETRAWIESRPPLVQEAIRRMPPGTWWRLKVGGFGIYTPYSYGEAEDGTVTLTVVRHDPLLPLMSYCVFGCHPEDFEWTAMDDTTTPEAFLAATR